ncbi:MAG: BolA/IbaG family iron-sulfur metabolism protein [Deltaproteobacteria bacterium]|nr:BolA/IbaG family iron-sulfur metabolism protein [Deltaproteobacteria bacterium]MBW2388578.1 BolA/IbaG family iron-sulfur metabolism protein [Deltaproteobacteria bacterium]
MSLNILGDDSATIIEQMRTAIESAVDCRELSIDSGSPGHFVIRVVSDAFADLGRVKQQQLIYGAIAHLMKGDGAPVHAIDRLECVKP